MKKFIKKATANSTVFAALIVVAIVVVFLVTAFCVSYPRLFYCTVTFDTNHGTEIAPIVVQYGATLADIPATQREYNTFGGWFYDKEYTKPYNGEKIQNDTLLYARWHTIFDTEYFRSMQTKLAQAYGDEFSLFLYEGTSEDDFIIKALDLTPFSFPEFKVYLIGCDDSVGLEVTLILALVFNTLQDAQDFYAQNVVGEFDDSLFMGDMEYFCADVLQGAVAIGNADIVLGEIIDGGDFHYAVNEEKTEASILRYKGDEDNVEIPDTYNGLPITALGAYSFYNKKLSAVSVRQNIKEIGYMSFAFCNNLASLSIPEGIEKIGNGFVIGAMGTDIHLTSNPYFKLEDGALYGNNMGRLITYIDKSCESFEVPEGVKVIGDYAFAYLSTLKNIGFPSGLEYICNYAFAYLGALKNIDLPRGLEHINDYAFAESGIENLRLPQSIIEIGAGAFKGTSDGTSPLKSVDFGTDSSLEILSMDAFADNPLLKTFVFTKNIRDIDRGILKNCTGLETVDFEQGIKINAIYPETFNNCTSLQQILLPDGVRMVTNAFENCTSLKHVYLNKVDNLQAFAFANSSALESVAFDSSSNLKQLQNSTFYNCTSLASIDLPDSLEVIASDVFYNCASLKNIDIKNTKEIASRAFDNCVGLESVNLQKVKSIAGYAFYNCLRLEQVDLSAAEFVGSSAFEGCAGLTTVIMSEALQELGNRAFEGCSLISKLTLPRGALIGDSFGGLPQGLVELTMPIVKNNDGHYIAPIHLFGYANLPASLQIIRISGSPIEIPERYFAEHNSVPQIIIPDSVESIGKRAFFDCNALTSFDTPSSLKEIGEFAFAGCTNLSDFVLPDGVVSIGEGAFSGNGSLKQQDFPSSLKTIGVQAYLDCMLFTEVVLPDGMQYVGNGAFGGCYGIQTMRVPLAPYEEGNHKYPSNLRLYTDVFRSDFVSNIKSVRLTRDTIIVPSKAFAGLDSIQSIVFPDTITRFEDNSLNSIRNVKTLDISMTSDYGTQIFWDCPSLEELTVAMDSVYNKTTPSWLGYFFATDYGIVFESEYESLKKVVIKGNNTTLAEGAFDGFDKLQEVVLPSTLTSISERLFQYCRELNKVVIPSSVTEIQKQAFAFCSSLVQIDIPAGVNYIGESAFRGATALETVNIPRDTAIFLLGDSIFSDCTSLKNIDIPDNTIWEIPYGMFQNCTSLTDFKIPSGLQHIRLGAFRGAGLTEVIIPYTVIEIDWYAFTDCVNIKKLEFEQLDLGDGNRHSRLSEIGRGAFMNCGLIEKIVLPASLNSIVAEAFKNCVSLKEVYVLHTYDYRDSGEYAWRTNSTRLDHGKGEEEVFYNCHKDILFYVPGGDNGVESYKNSAIGWKIYEAKIKPIPDDFKP